MLKIMHAVHRCVKRVKTSLHSLNRKLLHFYALFLHTFLSGSANSEMFRLDTEPVVPGPLRDIHLPIVAVRRFVK